jgi:hypothetical protein
MLVVLIELEPSWSIFLEFGSLTPVNADPIELSFCCKIGKEGYLFSLYFAVQTNQSLLV